MYQQKILNKNPTYPISISLTRTGKTQLESRATPKDKQPREKHDMTRRTVSSPSLPLLYVSGTIIDCIFNYPTRCSRITLSPSQPWSPYHPTPSPALSQAHPAQPHNPHPRPPPSETHSQPTISSGLAFPPKSQGQICTVAHAVA